jgi:NAD(P)H-flavin reductase
MAIAPPLEVRPELVQGGPAAATPADFATATIGEIRPETGDVKTLILRDVDPAFIAGQPGQFAMIAVPAYPPLPISISRYLPDGIELTVRAAGPATTVIVGLGVGDEVGLRGPLGSSWPLEQAVGRDVIFVTGGIGLAPLRPLIDAVRSQRNRFGAVRIFYGARTPNDMLYRDELTRWSRTPDLEVALTVDRANTRWTGPVGVVTHLFDRATWDGSRAVAFVCGPERMMQATVDALGERGLTNDRIFVTLERHMECGIGLCGHCQVGKHFVCRDGPIFSLAQLGDVFGREGI